MQNYNVFLYRDDHNLVSETSVETPNEVKNWILKYQDDYEELMQSGEKFEVFVTSRWNDKLLFKYDFNGDIDSAINKLKRLPFNLK